MVGGSREPLVRPARRAKVVKYMEQVEVMLSGR